MSRRARSACGLLAAVVAMLMATGIFVLAAAAPVSAQDGSITVDIKPLDDSGVFGTVVLAADGDQTLITVDLEGSEEGYEGHTFDSTCDDHQAATVFYALEPVDADGHSESVVDAPLADLTSGKFYVHIHRSAGEGGEGVACGQIPYAVGGVLPATGAGLLGDGGSEAWLLIGLAAVVGLLGASWMVRRQGMARG